MEEVTKISDDQLKEVVRTLLIVMKNSIFYAIDHPLCKSSVEQFMSILKKWFSSYPALRIDISQYEFDINGTTYDQHQIHSREIAQYLHNRGIISVIFNQSVTIKDLRNFFKIISNDVQTIKDQGGVLKSLPVESNIIVKELDYSYFLSFSTEAFSVKEEEIWDTLFKIANKKPHENLPDSSVELILEFFKDTKKSARLLNKIYKNALNQLSGEKAVDDIRKAITQICQHLEEKEEEKKKESQANIMSILFQLHMDLLTSLLKQTDTAEDMSSLSDEIVKHFSDTDIAEFISSLILTEGSLNERLLRIFNKLIPDQSKSKKVVPLVADQLFSQNFIHPFKLEPMQMSIKEIFKQNSNSHFLNQMYEITVDAVINKNIDSLTYIAKLAPEINQFVQSMEDKHLIREKVLLILNLLYLERNPEDFKKLNNNILNLLPSLLQNKDIYSIRNIFDLFNDKINPDQKKNILMRDEIHKTIQQISSPKTLKEIISYIPNLDHDLKHIVHILKNFKKQSAPMLISVYLCRRGSIDKVKFKKVFSVMKQEIVTEICKRFKSPKPFEIKVLFPLLQHFAPDKAKTIAKNMIESSDNQIVFLVLNYYNPENQIDINKIYDIYSKSNDREIKKRTAILLLKTRNKTIIETLFQNTKQSLFKKSFLVDLVKLSGNTRIQESYPFIKEIFIKSPILSTRKKEKLRLIAANSLLRLDPVKSFELIKTNSNRGSKYFKKHCRQMLTQYKKISNGK
ncbi:MAG: hypothetical protein R6V04_06560 [bacterium]